LTFCNRRFVIRRFVFSTFCNSAFCNSTFCSTINTSIPFIRSVVLYVLNSFLCHISFFYFFCLNSSGLQWVDWTYCNLLDSLFQSQFLILWLSFSNALTAVEQPYEELQFLLSWGMCSPLQFIAWEKMTHIRTTRLHLLNRYFTQLVLSSTSHGFVNWNCNAESEFAMRIQIQNSEFSLQIKNSNCILYAICRSWSCGTRRMQKTFNLECSTMLY
jgi:hypothetical protein